MNEKRVNGAMNQDALYLECSQAVRALARRFGYAYLDEAQFIELVYERVRHETPVSMEDRKAYITNICKNVYARELYNACAGAHGENQDRAFSELGNYLYKIAVHFLLTRGCSNSLAQDKAHDCVQETLKNIYIHIQEVRDPGGFLDYAIHAITRECGKDFHRPIATLVEMVETLPVSDAQVKQRMVQLSQQVKHDAESGNPAPDVVYSLIDCLKQAARLDPDLQKQIARITRQLRQSNQETEIQPVEEIEIETPFSIAQLDGCKLDCVLHALSDIENKDQRIILVLQYFSEFDDGQIATLLRTNRNNIYQLRRRAIDNFDREAVILCMQEC